MINAGARGAGNARYEVSSVAAVAVYCPSDAVLARNRVFVYGF